MGSLSVWHLLVLLAMIVVLFGTRKVRSIGSDLGAAVREFRQATGENYENDIHGVYRQVAQSHAHAAGHGAGNESR